MRILFLTSDLDVTNGWGRYSAGFSAEARKRNGEESVVIPDPASLRSSRDGKLKFFHVVRDAIRWRTAASGVDLIHAATEPVAPLARLLSFWTRKPYMISAHGTYASAAAYPPSLRGMYQASFRGAAAVVAVSRYTADVVKQSFAPRRVEVIPGGFSAPPAPVPRGGFATPPRLLSVGALKPRKGFHTLIEALAPLGAGGPRCEIVGSAGGLAPRRAKGEVAGTTAYQARLVERVRQLGLEGSIRFLGRVDDDELDRLYARADLFVLPSEHDGAKFEGLGLVYLEALSRGTPVIGCLDSGAEDVIQDGVNGLLVPPGDPEKLSTAIRRILGDAMLWKRMSDAAPKSVERFRWERVGTDMDALYKELVKTYAR